MVTFDPVLIHKLVNLLMFRVMMMIMKVKLLKKKVKCTIKSIELQKITDFTRPQSHKKLPSGDDLVAKSLS